MATVEIHSFINFSHDPYGGANWSTSALVGTGGLDAAGPDGQHVNIYANIDLTTLPDDAIISQVDFHGVIQVVNASIVGGGVHWYKHAPGSPTNGAFTPDATAGPGITFPFTDCLKTLSSVPADKTTLATWYIGFSLEYTTFSGEPYNITFTTTDAYVIITYEAPGLNPSSGHRRGGNSVAIIGTGFYDGLLVNVGGTVVTPDSVPSDTEIDLTMPAHIIGPVTVTVYDPSSLQVFFSGTYTYVKPVVSSVAIDHGAMTGGTAVTVTGENFEDGDLITFDGILATSVVFVDTEHMTCVTPAHVAGPVTVTVLTP